MATLSFAPKKAAAAPPAAPMPVPPADLRERVSGTRDATWFDQSGARTVDEWERALKSAGLRMTDYPVIVDFGCGCGRAMQHLVRRMGLGHTLIGMDTDREAIDWMSANMPGCTAKLLGELPPGPLATGSADLVLSHSVFTHLPEDVQFLWLADLQRVLQPNGVLVASFHGQKAVGDYLRSLDGLVPAESITGIRATLDTTGFYHVSGRTVAEQSYPQYYGAAFHTVAYIVREWLKYFDLLAWHPTFALDVQDVVVLRAKKLTSDV